MAEAFGDDVGRGDFDKSAVSICLPTNANPAMVSSQTSCLERDSCEKSSLVGSQVKHIYVMVVGVEDLVPLALCNTDKVPQLMMLDSDL